MPKCATACALSDVAEVDILTRYVPKIALAVIGNPTVGGITPPVMGRKFNPEYDVLFSVGVFTQI